jgi:hypothetical protein
MEGEHFRDGLDEVPGTLDAEAEPKHMAALAVQGEAEAAALLDDGSRTSPRGEGE